MKRLSVYTYFDIEGFLERITLMLIGIRDWLDYDTQKVLGMKAETVIIEDNNDYGSSNGEVVNNLFEKLIVKIPKKLDNIPLKSKVRLVNPEAVVYGEFRNQLSITADDIEVID
jgi:hypothetical protein